jgi:hypothetical protein
LALLLDEPGGKQISCPELVSIRQHCAMEPGNGQNGGLPGEEWREPPGRVLDSVDFGNGASHAWLNPTHGSGVRRIFHAFRFARCSMTIDHVDLLFAMCRVDTSTQMTTGDVQHMVHGLCLFSIENTRM